MSIPKHFRFSIGGYFGPTYRFELEDEELLYRVYLHADELPAEARIRPSREQWRAFRRQIDQLNIWSWPADCYQQDGHIDLMVMDGTSWSLCLAYPDQEIESTGGTSAYPPDLEEHDFPGETSFCFFQFLQLLNKLAGLPERAAQDPRLRFADAQEPTVDEEE